MEIWTFKYEPTSMDQLVLNDELREILNKTFIDLPNLFIHGVRGTGKSCFAKIFIEKIGADFIKINASDETGIDMIRNKLKSFATSYGMGKLKYIILNEMDQLSSNAQNALKDLIEEVQEITRFILITNHPTKITDEILSRFVPIEFSNPPATKIAHRLMSILDQEGIKKVDKKLLAELIIRCYPDIRKTINILQLNCKNGEFTKLALMAGEESYKKIFDALVNKEVPYPKTLEIIRKELRGRGIDYVELYSYLYENIGKFSLPGDMIILIGDHLSKNSYIGNREINFVAMVCRAIKGNLLR